MRRIVLTMSVALILLAIGCHSPNQHGRGNSRESLTLVTDSSDGQIRISVDLVSCKYPRRSAGSCLLFRVRDGQVLADGVEGSPVVDESEEVVAVLTDKLGDGNSPLFLASPSSRAFASIERAKGHFGEATLTKDLSPIPQAVSLRVGDRIAFGPLFGKNGEHGQTIATISCLKGNLAVAHGPGPPGASKLHLSLWGRVMYVAYRANVVGVSGGPQVREIYDYGEPVGTVVFVDPQTIVVAPNLLPKRIPCEFTYRLDGDFLRQKSTAVPARNPVLIPAIGNSTKFFLYHCPIPDQANISVSFQVDSEEPLVSMSFETNRFGQAQIWVEKTVTEMLRKGSGVDYKNIRIEVVCESIGQN